MSLPEDVVPGSTGHIAHHNAIHDVQNAIGEQVIRLAPVPSPVSKFAHVQRDHGQVQAAIADTSGATLGNLELEVNKLKAALRAVGVILP